MLLNNFDKSVEAISPESRPWTNQWPCSFSGSCPIGRKTGNRVHSYWLQWKGQQPTATIKTSVSFLLIGSVFFKTLFINYFLRTFLQQQKNFCKQNFLLDFLTLIVLTRIKQSTVSSKSLEKISLKVHNTNIPYYEVFTKSPE